MLPKFGHTQVGPLSSPRKSRIYRWPARTGLVYRSVILTFPPVKLLLIFHCNYSVAPEVGMDGRMSSSRSL